MEIRIHNSHLLQPQYEEMLHDKIEKQWRRATGRRCSCIVDNETITLKIEAPTPDCLRIIQSIESHGLQRTTTRHFEIEANKNIYSRPGLRFARLYGQWLLDEAGHHLLEVHNTPMGRLMGIRHIDRFAYRIMTEVHKLSEMDIARVVHKANTRTKKRSGRNSPIRVGQTTLFGLVAHQDHVRIAMRLDDQCRWENDHLEISTVNMAEIVIQSLCSSEGRRLRGIVDMEQIDENWIIQKAELANLRLGQDDRMHVRMTMPITSFNLKY